MLLLLLLWLLLGVKPAARYGAGAEGREGGGKRRARPRRTLELVELTEKASVLPEVKEHAAEPQAERRSRAAATGRSGGLSSGQRLHDHCPATFAERHLRVTTVARAVVAGGDDALNFGARARP